MPNHNSKKESSENSKSYTNAVQAIIDHTTQIHMDHELFDLLYSKTGPIPIGVVARVAESF